MDRRRSPPYQNLPPALERLPPRGIRSDIGDQVLRSHVNSRAGIIQIPGRGAVDRPGLALFLENPAATIAGLAKAISGTSFIECLHPKRPLIRPRDREKENGSPLH
jgi:hypothetical protein